MSVRTSRDWRFNDDLAGRPRAIPTSWLDAGEHEPVGAGEERLFPVLMRVGKDLEWTVGQGELQEGPHRERPAIEVLYATVDGEEAHARIIPADRTADGVRPTEFAALASVGRGELQDVGVACQPLYRALVGAISGDDVSAQTVLTAWRNDGVDGLEEVSSRVE